MKKFTIFMCAILAAICVSNCSPAFGQGLFYTSDTTNTFQFDGIGVGVTGSFFSGEVPENLKNQWGLEFTPIFQIGKLFYLAPNLEYTRQYRSGSGGLDVYVMGIDRGTYKIFTGVSSNLVDFAKSDSTGNVEYNPVVGGGFKFGIVWREFYGIKPIIVFNQTYYSESNLLSDKTVISTRPRSETTITIGIKF